MLEPVTETASSFTTSSFGAASLESAGAIWAQTESGAIPVKAATRNFRPAIFFRGSIRLMSR
jgi:hypothetical protein